MVTIWHDQAWLVWWKNFRNSQNLPSTPDTDEVDTPDTAPDDSAGDGLAPRDQRRRHADGAAHVLRVLVGHADLDALQARRATRP